MKKEECYFLGKVTQTHGVKGEVKIWLDVDDPEDYAELDSVLLEINNKLVPYFIEEIAIRGKKSIARFEEMKTWEDAQEIIGAEMYLPLNNLPELAGNQFYYHEIVGYKIVDNQTKEVFGEVSAVFEGAGQDLIAFYKEEKEVLIPINDAIVLGVNRELKELFVDLPEGLIDLYLES